VILSAHFFSDWKADKTSLWTKNKKHAHRTSSSSPRARDAEREKKKTQRIIKRQKEEDSTFVFEARER
jgi:hypothetical protein